MASSDTERAVERVSERRITSGFAGAMMWWITAILIGVLLLSLGLPVWPALPAAFLLGLWIAAIVDRAMR